MIILRNKEFSSKEQKALRKAYDLAKGLSSPNIDTNVPKRRLQEALKIEDVGNAIRKEGRRISKTFKTAKRSVDDRINIRANQLGNGAQAIRNPQSPIFGGKEIGPQGPRGEGISKSMIKNANKDSRYGYDHGYIPNDKIEEKKDLVKQTLKLGKKKKIKTN